MKQKLKPVIPALLCKPEEIVRAICLLADERRSSFMTGQAMITAGGATEKLSTEQEK